MPFTFKTYRTFLQNNSSCQISPFGNLFCQSVSKHSCFFEKQRTPVLNGLQIRKLGYDAHYTRFLCFLLKPDSVIVQGSVRVEAGLEIYFQTMIMWPLHCLVRRGFLLHRMSMLILEWSRWRGKGSRYLNLRPKVFDKYDIISLFIISSPQNCFAKFII